MTRKAMWDAFYELDFSTDSPDLIRQAKRIIDQNVSIQGVGSLAELKGSR